MPAPTTLPLSLYLTTQFQSPIPHSNDQASLTFLIASLTLTYRAAKNRTLRYVFPYDSSLATHFNSPTDCCKSLERPEPGYACHVCPVHAFLIGVFWAQHVACFVAIGWKADKSM